MCQLLCWCKGKLAMRGKKGEVGRRDKKTDPVPTHTETAVYWKGQSLNNDSIKYDNVKKHFY